MTITPEEEKRLEQLIEQLKVMGDQRRANQYQEILDAWRGGDYKSMQQIVAASPGISMNADEEKWLDNMISQQNTAEAREYETGQRDTSILSAANQLEQLGLASSGVLQTGGVSTNAVGTAQNSHTNLTMQRHAQKMALARQLISMTGQMASAGIYGGAIAQAKQAASVVSSAASHSAYRALSKIEQQKYEARVKEFENNGNVYDLGPSDMSDWLVR